MYSSSPPYETSEQWRNEVNQREKIKFRVVATGESNDDALWVIRKMSELLNKSETFYCFFLPSSLKSIIKIMCKNNILIKTKILKNVTIAMLFT